MRIGNMETKNENYGLVYGLTNPSFKGMVKIGVTRSLDINKRMRVLGTDVPFPFECAFAYKVPHDSLFTIEHTLHENYEDKRVKGSEFFRVEPQKVDNLLRMLGRFEPMKTVVQSAIDTAAEDELQKIEKRKSPNMDFFEMGLGVGSILIYNNDEAIRCNVIEAKKVEYNGTTYSLSNLTHQLLGTKHAVRPAPLWHTEDGKSLLQLYNESLAAQLSANDSALAAANAEYEQYKNDCQ